MKLNQMLERSDDLMYKQFINENTLYTDETKEDFVDDESKIVNAFAMNFVGILGAYNAAIQSSNDRSLNQIKRYFKSDASVRPDAIGDTNHNISLVIKLMRDKKMFISDAKAVQMTRFLALAKQGQLDLIDDAIVRDWVNNIKLPSITKADSKIKDILMKFKNDVFTLVDSSRELRRIRAKVGSVSDEFWNVSKTVRYKTKGDVEPETSEAKEARDAKKAADVEPDDVSVVTPVEPEPEVVPAPQMGFGLPADPIPAAPTANVEPEVVPDPEPEAAVVPAALVDDPELVQDRELRRRIADYFIARINSGMDGFRLGSTVDRAYKMERDKKEDPMFLVRDIVDDKSPNADQRVSDLETKAVAIMSSLASAVGRFTQFTDASVNGIDLTSTDLPYASDFRGIAAMIGTELRRNPKLAFSGSITNYMTNVTLPYDKVSSYFGISSREYYHMMLGNPGVSVTLMDDIRSPYNFTIDGLFTAIARSSSEDDRSKFASLMPDVVEAYFIHKAPDVLNLAGTGLVHDYAKFAQYGILGNVYKTYSDTLTAQWTKIKDSGFDRSFVTSVPRMVNMTALLMEWGQPDLLKGSIAVLATINALDDAAFTEATGSLLMMGERLMTACMEIGSPRMVEEIEDMMIRNLKLGNFFTATDFQLVTDKQMDHLMKGHKDDVERIRQTMFDYISNVSPSKLNKLNAIGSYLMDANSPSKSIEQIVNHVSEHIDPSLQGPVLNALFARLGYITNAEARTEMFLTIHEMTDKVMPPPADYYETVGRYVLEGKQAVRFLKLDLSRNGFISKLAGDIKGREDKAMFKDALFDMAWDALELDPAVADEFYNSLPTADKTKFRNRVSSAGAVSAQLGSGLIELGAKLDAHRIKEIFTYNDLDADAIAAAYDLKANKNEKFSEYAERVNVASREKSPLIEPAIEDLNLTPAEMAAKADFMIKNHHAGKHGNVYPKITRAFAVKLPDEAFQKFRNEMIARNLNDSVVPAYHGTGGVAASMILRYGFKVISAKDQSVVGRAIGDGIYFSNKIDKVLQYVGNAGFTRGVGTKGYIFEMDTTLGQPHVDFQSAGFEGSTDVDANFISPEWAVFNPGAQLKILKCYEVEIVTKKDADALIARDLIVSESRKNFANFLTEAKAGNTNAITYRFFDNRIPVIRDGKLRIVRAEDFEHCGSKVIRAYSDGKIATVVIKNPKTMVIDTMLRKMSTKDVETFNNLMC
ncbi:hypothetical protein AHP1_401 [Aeromonas phage Ahp1_CNU-2021]|nr:hypothetical protein AHP1_401 [Aeromonas phage Ahp1_CNU-2021]